MSPEKPAFTGLVTHYVAALIDAGKPGEAVTYAESAVERLRVAGREASWELGAESARALLAAGRPEDALNALQAAAGFQPDDPVAKEHRDGVRRALILAKLGRTAEAVDALPDLDVVGEHPACSWSGRGPSPYWPVPRRSPTPGSSAACCASGSTTSA